MKLLEKMKALLPACHSYAHLAYFGAVFVEGHGVYAVMGGLLLALGVLSLVWKGGDE